MPKWPNHWHKDDPVKFSPVLRRYTLDYPWDQVDAKTKKLLEQGRMQMKCPNCGTESPAGPWCYKCYRMVRPENWYTGTIFSPEGKRRRGRPTKAEMTAAMPVCEVCVL
jgi:hypothetical protein